MFGFGTGELLFTALITLLVVGPKDLPRVMRMMAQGWRKIRFYSLQANSFINALIAEAELEDVEKRSIANPDANNLGTRSSTMQTTREQTTREQPEDLTSVERKQP